MNEPDWQGKPRHPIRDVLKRIIGKAPPQYVRGYDYSNFTDGQHSDLQDWVSLNLPVSLEWSTAIGVIDAAQTIVEEAVSNGNIPASDSEWRLDGHSYGPRKKTKKTRKRK